MHTKPPAPLTAPVLQTDVGFWTKALQDITDTLAVRLGTVLCLLCLLVWQSCEPPCVTVGCSVGPPASPTGMERRGVQASRHHAIASRGDGVRPLSSVTTSNTPHIPPFGHWGKKQWELQWGTLIFVSVEVRSKSTDKSDQGRTLS